AVIALTIKMDPSWRPTTEMEFHAVTFDYCDNELLQKTGSSSHRRFSLVSAFIVRCQQRTSRRNGTRHMSSLLWATTLRRCSRKWRTHPRGHCEHPEMFHRPEQGTEGTGRHRDGNRGFLKHSAAGWKRPVVPTGYRVTAGRPPALPRQTAMHPP